MQIFRGSFWNEKIVYRLTQLKMTYKMMDLLSQWPLNINMAEQLNTFYIHFWYNNFAVASPNNSPSSGVE